MRIAFVGINPTTALDVAFETIHESRSLLDASMQYRISDSMRLFLDVKNITEEHLRATYQTHPTFPEAYDVDGRQWVFGVRGSF